MLSLVLAGAVVSGLASCGSTQDNALAGKTPTAILNTALSAASTFGGVHYVLKTSGAGQTQTVTGDAETNEGIQSIVVGADQTVVELIGTRAYLRGNAGGLQEILGLAATPATRYAGKWISFEQSDSLYGSVVQGVTLEGLLSQQEPKRPLVESTPGIVAGRQVVGIRGGLGRSSSDGEATIWVVTAAPNVPVGVDAQATTNNKTVTEVGVFSKWGEKFHLKAPSSAAPFSSLVTK